MIKSNITEILSKVTFIHMMAREVIRWFYPLKNGATWIEPNCEIKPKISIKYVFICCNNDQVSVLRHEYTIIISTN